MIMLFKIRYNFSTRQYVSNRSLYVGARGLVLMWIRLSTRATKRLFLRFTRCHRPFNGLERALSWRCIKSWSNDIDQRFLETQWQHQSNWATLIEINANIIQLIVLNSRWAGSFFMNQSHRVAAIDMNYKSIITVHLACILFRSLLNLYKVLLAMIPLPVTWLY